MFNEVFGNQIKIRSILHPSVSPSKIILFEKQYQAFDAVFHHQSSRAWNQLQRAGLPALLRFYALGARCSFNVATPISFTVFFLNKQQQQQNNKIHYKVPFFFV